MPRFYNAPVASGVALVALMAAPLAANAASSFQTGAGTLTATAAVDFTITIPRVLFLQVGTGSFLTTNAAVNLITFSVPAASVGNGTPVAATAGSGDIGNGTVTARVFGNGAANVSLSATNGGALNDGAGNTISWAQVTTTASALAGVPTLLNPITLVDGATTPVSLPAVAGVVNQGAQWTYSYLNTATPVGGTYGGVNTNNGRVTYTATLP